MPDALPLAELMTRLHAGDQEAGTEIARRFGDDVRGYIRCQLLVYGLKHRYDATEIWSSVWRRFLTRLHEQTWQAEWATPEGLRKYFMRTAHNAVIQKKRLLDNQQGQLPEQYDAADDGEGPEDAALIRDLLDTALARCNEDERTLLRLRYLDGLTLAQVAERLGRDDDSIRLQLDKLRARLKRQMRE